MKYLMLLHMNGSEDLAPNPGVETACLDIFTSFGLERDLGDPPVRM
jgi:hypothetical protein